MGESMTKKITDILLIIFLIVCCITLVRVNLLINEMNSTHKLEDIKKNYPLLGEVLTSLGTKVEENIKAGNITSRESATKGNLGALRSAVAIYYGDKEGKWPSYATIISKDFNAYINPIPPEKITGSNKIVKKFDGTGGWYYVTQKGSEQGNVYLNLDGKDSRGTPYKDY